MRRSPVQQGRIAARIAAALEPRRGAMWQPRATPWDCSRVVVAEPRRGEITDDHSISPLRGSGVKRGRGPGAMPLAIACRPFGASFEGPSRSAFTLLEVLLAMAIASLL